MLADRDRKLDPTRDTRRGRGRGTSQQAKYSPRVVIKCEIKDQDVECRKLSQQRLRIYVQKNIMIVTHNLRLCKHVSASVFQLHLPRSSVLAAVLLQTADTRWTSAAEKVTVFIETGVNCHNTKQSIQHLSNITSWWYHRTLPLWRIISTWPIYISTNYASTPVTAG